MLCFLKKESPVVKDNSIRPKNGMLCFSTVETFVLTEVKITKSKVATNHWSKKIKHLVTTLSK